MNVSYSSGLASRLLRFWVQTGSQKRHDTFTAFGIRTFRILKNDISLEGLTPQQTFSMGRVGRVAELEHERN
jgi:hypothetical protein